MKAMQVNGSLQPPRLEEATRPKPVPQKGEVLIRVEAAGAIPTELNWYPTQHTKSGAPRQHAIPGHEFSGVIAELGQETEGFSVGQKIYGMNDWFAEGATAGYCLAQPRSIASSPTSLNHAEAASIPISALTAWQGLYDRANIQAGERLLIHGAGGAVGIFAVLLARLRGAHIIATASVEDRDFLSGLGVEQVIDYKAERFENRTRDLDIVFDTVGGKTLARSWPLLKPSGRMVTVSSAGEDEMDERTKAAFFIVEPNQHQLIEVAKLLDAGKLKAYVKEIVPFANSSAAYDGTLPETKNRGKVVIEIPEEAAE